MVFSLFYAIHCSTIVHRQITEKLQTERKKGGAMNRMGCAVQNGTKQNKKNKV